MSINISVIIWTVVNFCILLVALNFVLYKPLLKFIHERNERNEKGIDAGKNADILLEKAKNENREALENLRREEQKNTEDALHEARANKRAALAQMNERLDKEYREGLEKLAKDEEAAEAQLDAKLDVLSKIIADKVSGGFI